MAQTKCTAVHSLGMHYAPAPIH